MTARRWLEQGLVRSNPRLPTSLHEPVLMVIPSITSLSENHPRSGWCLQPGTHRRNR
jgi:hypothetical protein